jgi:hypothetical protein
MHSRVGGAVLLQASRFEMVHFIQHMGGVYRKVTVLRAVHVFHLIDNANQSKQQYLRRASTTIGGWELATREWAIGNLNDSEWTYCQ